jgi:hypothetical protein
MIQKLQKEDEKISIPGPDNDAEMSLLKNSVN